MDCREDVFLRDEKFDFDVSLSPACTSSEEDEVFVGPIGHKERCVSTTVVSQLLNDGTGAAEHGSWSPLTGDQLDAMCLEAHKLATQLKSCKPQGEDTNQLKVKTEEFVQDAEAKLDVIIHSSRVLSPIKRETFSVQDSPMKLLPPAIQRQLQNRSFSATLATTTASSTHHSTSSPVAGSRAPTRMTLRGKAAVGSTVLPNRPSVPMGSFSASKHRKDPNKLQPPSKVTGPWKRSPSSRLSQRAPSSEDLHSDSASVASDISDSSLNCSLLGKRGLAPPTKGVGVRKPSAVKTPSLSNRRNTSSSSSSVSSFNSSLSLSPSKGKLNSSLNRSIINSTSPAPSSISKPANRGNVRRSTARLSTEPAAILTSRSSLSTHNKKLSESLPAKVAKTTPQKHAEAAAMQPTPTKRQLESGSSIRSSTTGRPQSSIKAKSKPKTSLPPTPSAGSQSASDKGLSTVVRPKRLMSLCSLESLPLKPSSGTLTPSASLCKSVQVQAQRRSGLPTPVKRRALAIPSLLSSNLSKAISQPPILNPQPSSSATRKQISCSLAPEPVEVPDIKPFCLEEEEAELPSSPPSHSQEPNQSESLSPVAVCQSDSETNTNLQDPPLTKENLTTAQEVLLLDLPAPSLQPQEKLLIDLTNTPDLIRTNAKPCTGTQLIDLSSPLIKWSPEEKIENNAPLINLSF